MSETHAALLRRASAALGAAGIEGAARDAELLLRWAAGMDGAAFSVRRMEAASADATARFEEALERRLRREPVSHIVGAREFWGRRFEVNRDVLDPRPESETTIAAALRRPGGRVLDLGVGSGCLLGAVLAERPGATGLGVDASEAALAVAARNLAALGLGERATLRKGDWLDGVEGRFDIVLCNPPYIAETEMAGLAPEVREHEPLMALTPGGDGLAPYRAIAPALAAVLAPGGTAFFEIGPTQAKDVTEIFAAAGWAPPRVHKDMDGRDRCLEFHTEG